MEIVAFLIAFPILAALILLLVRNEKLRAAIVITAAAIIMIASVYLAINHLFAPALSIGLTELQGEYITYGALLVSIVCAIYIIIKGIQHKRYFAIILAVIQLCAVVLFEFLIAHNVEIVTYLYVDQFSIIMALIIGIIGSGICIYSLGYMRDFQAHEDKLGKRDRRPIFFALMFLFLSAMFAIVFCNNLVWLFCAWEVTTVCSFALIGYTRTEEAVANSFRQVVMNLIGGLAFVAALVLLGSMAEPVLEFTSLINLGAAGLVMLPIMLIALAGFTKAAQVPFQSWLLGAMVAPTPTSALLHSSTMVKAGVFILIRLAPCFGFNINGMMVVLVGGITFLFCSAVAISQTNAKRVLAYSTVATLGLIVACAGLGTPEAVWAAIFLLIFHAAAKSLLFLCVGTAEHHIGSRDIEDMDAIFERMPRLALFMALGMLCMFVAPFGMLIAKWAVLVSVVQSFNIVLMLILAFGSALTFVFWAKWLGKILAIAHSKAKVESGVHASEWFALTLMAVLVVMASIWFPLISQSIVVPYIEGVKTGVLSGLDLPFWEAILPTIDYDNLLIMAIIVAALLIAFIFQLFLRRRRTDKLDIYLSGVGLDFEKRTFRNSLSGETEATQRNWYLGSWFGEKTLLPLASVVSVVVLAAGLILAIIGIGGLL
ncbi:MAG: NADH-quinone oxidoreductase subunit L [Coriobacteriia bacterium]|nr:NADH-quinone oxidoreductase subunit L [Coriobacteriia bacterium]